MILDPLRLGIDLNSKNVSDTTQQAKDQESHSCNKGIASTFKQKLQAADNMACIQVYIQATLKSEGLFSLPGYKSW